MYIWYDMYTSISIFYLLCICMHGTVCPTSTFYICADIDAALCRLQPHTYILHNFTYMIHCNCSLVLVLVRMWLQSAQSSVNICTRNTVTLGTCNTITTSNMKRTISITISIL